MKLLTLIGLLSILTMSSNPSFLSDQLDYQRVRKAHDEYYESLSEQLSKLDIHSGAFSIYLRAFKEEGELEVWLKADDDATYTLFKTYAVCAKSGELGPKRQQGDKQVPEGFYHIDRFNPKSLYHLSMGINYPNRSDKARSKASKLGGDIFIHGDCMTIGCLPITDEKIAELYLLCVMAKDRGATNIPVNILPWKMNPSNYSKWMSNSDNSEFTKELWSELKSAYDYFETKKKLPGIRFSSDGSQRVVEG